MLLNNGITIVAKTLNKVGSAFKISDFQIVNGCQTSHVLHNLKDSIDESTLIPLKLIITDNEDVINEIIKATNSQTEVKNEAFEILKPFHKKLESFYLSFNNDENKRVFYERRSRQFTGNKAKNERIIGLSTQTASYVAMFLNEPQSTHRYFGELLKAYANRLFLENHSYFPYYISGLGSCIIDDLFRTGILNQGNRRFKYHLLLMFRIQVAGQKIPINVVSNKDLEKYCLKLAEVLWNQQKTIEIFKSLETKLSEAVKKTTTLKRQAHSIRAFTEELLPIVLSNKKSGEITYYNSEKGFGFVRIFNTENDIFFHYTEIQKSYSGIIKITDKLEFDIFDSERGPQAKNISVFPS